MISGYNKHQEETRALEQERECGRLPLHPARGGSGPGTEAEGARRTPHLCRTELVFPDAARRRGASAGGVCGLCSDWRVSSRALIPFSISHMRTCGVHNIVNSWPAKAVLIIMHRTFGGGNNYFFLCFSVAPCPDIPDRLCTLSVCLPRSGRCRLLKVG